MMKLTSRDVQKSFIQHCHHTDVTEQKHKFDDFWRSFQVTIYFSIQLC